MGGSTALLWLFAAAVLTASYIRSTHCQLAFTNEPADTVVALGTAARFDCVFTASDPVSISWQRDGATLTPSSKYSFLLNNSLVINPTEMGDDGTYSCVINNQITGESLQRSATLSFAEFQESFVTTPISQTIEEGGTISLFCVNEGSLPPATLTWQFNGQPVTITSSRIIIVTSTLDHLNPPRTSSTLYITSAVAADHGNYTCIATNVVIPGAIAITPAATLTIRATPRPPVITESPVDTLITSIGQSITLSCSALGEPSPTYTWTFNGATVLPASNVTIVSTASSSNLILLSVQIEHVGNYSCTAMNSQGSATSDSAALEIAIISETFEVGPFDRVVVIGRSTVLSCLPPPSTPPAIIGWLKAFTPITDPRYQILSNGSLLISDVVWSDQGIYHCTATNPVLGIVRTSSSAQLTAIGVPVVTPAAINVAEGDSAMFSCSAEGDPAPLINWYRGSTQITMATSSRVTLTASTITITAITLSDEDYYICRAVFTGAETESRAILNVLSAPIFLEPSITVIVVIPTSVVLPCDIFPDPTITFSWRFSGSAVVLSSLGNYRLLENGSLWIVNVTTDNDGVYTCVAMNNRGRAEGTVTLDVLFPPMITTAASFVNVTIGSTATFTCTATGNPAPAITWSHDGQQLVTNGRYLISSDRRTLSVLNAQQDDDGVYMCHASSQVGSQSDSINLDVQAAPMVLVAPPTQELLAGSTASFTCSVSGDPAPTVRWLDAQSVNVINSRNPRVQVLSDFTLVITAIQLEDAQQYVCEAFNPVGTANGITLLTVLAAPSVSIPVATTSVQEEPLILDCNAIGWPIPTIMWFRDGNELTLDSRIQLTTTGQLFISSVTTSDSGMYTCAASNEIGMANTTTVLSVLVRPTIQPGPTIVTIDQGDVIILNCATTGLPQPEVFWFQGSIPVPNQSLPHIMQAENDSLIINGVFKSDEGGYICWARNSVGNASLSVTLRVNVPPSISAVERFITAVQGSRARLSCLATGDPFPVQTWTRNGIEINGMSSVYTLESDGAVLVLGNVSVDDEGEFQCHASNVVRAAVDTVTLNVIVPPTFTPPLTDSIAVENSALSLICLASGDPPPFVVWSQNSEPLSTSGTLTFAPVSRNETGTYRCTATNSAGTIMQDIFLNVLYEPTITHLTESMVVHVNNETEIVCMTDGNPSPTISWQLNGAIISGASEEVYRISPVTATSAGLYNCVVNNSVGTMSASLTITVLFPPSPPALLSVTTLSAFSISVSWAGPADNGGSPIIGYRVEYRPQGSTDMFIAVNFAVDIRAAELTELSAFVIYEVQVVAVNLVGFSDPSVIMSTRTHPAAPVAPGNLRITSATFSSINLVWEIPDPLNGIFAAYELRYGDEMRFEADMRSRLLFSTQTLVGGLSVGIVYQVEVRAGTVSLIGEILYGPFATIRVLNGMAIEIVTQAPTELPSTPPTTAISTTTLPLTTMVPPTEQPIIPEPTEPSPIIGTTAITSSSDFISPSLSLQTSSSIASTPSPTSLPQSPPTVVPALVTALIPDGTEGEIFVYWREPTSGLDTFIGYQIILSPPPPSTVTTPILANKTRVSGTIRLQGLEHATTYVVTVATYNEAGLGPLTMSATVTTPESVPTEPRLVQVTELSQQVVIVSWLPPDPTNGVILDYTVTVYSEPSGQLLTETTVDMEIANIAGLDLLNLYYSIRITARTGAGMGNESESVFFGIEQSTIPTTIEPMRDSTTMSTSLVSTDSISTPITPMTSSTPSQPSDMPTPQTGPQILTQLNFTTSENVCDDPDYIVVCIVPPVVIGVLLLIAVLLLTVILCVRQKRILSAKKKGIYEVDHTDDQELNLTLEGERVVATDNIKTSAYQALNANFSYGKKDNIDEPDIGIDLPEKELMDTLSPVGRDALEEPASRPDSEEVSPSHYPGNHKPQTPAGDYTYAEVESIRSKKAQDRARYATPTPSRMTFDPSIGLSSGGLMETRIGAVGHTRNLSHHHHNTSQTEVAAQMY